MEDRPIWDRYGPARTIAQVLAEQQTPPPEQPQSYTAPVWQQRENLARMSGISHPELMVLRSGVHPEEGHAERMAAEGNNIRVGKLKRAARNGDKDSEVALAKALGLGDSGKPDHGPEFY